MGDILRDKKHLKILSYFYYAFAIIVLLSSIFFISNLKSEVAELAAAVDQIPDSADAPKAFFMKSLLIISLVRFSSGWIFSLALIFAGYFLSQDKHYKFCLTVAVLSCFFAPLGAILGAVTIFVLIRPSVKEIFGRELS